MVQQLLDNKHLSSVFNNECELLNSILKLHNNDKDIELDPMYFRGMFYREFINKPKYRFDINPLSKDVEKANAKELPIKSESINCMILDPPFLFEIRNRKSSSYAGNTHGILKGFGELEDLYKGILKESYRILKNKGILIFKCQDYTDSKTTMTHCFVYKWATELGFYAKDIVILVNPTNKIYHKDLKQRHFRKIHSYFWVFQKEEYPDVIYGSEEERREIEQENESKVK